MVIIRIKKPSKDHSHINNSNTIPKFQLGFKEISCESSKIEKKNLHASNIQWYMVNIPIPKGGMESEQGKTKSKMKHDRKNNESYRATASIRDSWWNHLSYNTLVWSRPSLWQCNLSLPGSISMPTAILGKQPIVPSSPKFCNLHCNLGFTFTASGHGLSAPAFRKSNPDSHCLTSEIFWNLGTCL